MELNEIIISDDKKGGTFQSMSVVSWPIKSRSRPCQAIYTFKYTHALFENKRTELLVMLPPNGLKSQHSDIKVFATLQIQMPMFCILWITFLVYIWNEDGTMVKLTPGGLVY